MDNEKLKQFIVPILVFVVGVVAGIFIISKVVVNFQNYLAYKADYELKNTDLQLKQSQLEQFKREESETQKALESAGADKPFYKSIEQGLDTEAVIAGEFAEILQLIQANKIKVRSITYDYNPSDDEFVKGASDKYNVARLNTEMIANYSNYDNFLKELYKHEHFLDIQSVEIVPYRKNKKILLINFKLKLYAQK